MDGFTEPNPFATDGIAAPSAITPLRGLPAGNNAAPSATALLSPTRGEWGVGSVAGI